jgi:hypothetical protein
LQERHNIKIWGQQSAGSKLIDFSNQIGIYILYDDQRIVYVGRTSDQTIGKRIFQHTSDRLSGRWNRFSWFGLKGVNTEGILIESNNTEFNSDIFILTLESILIESLEPPQNRRAGDMFRGIEYLQAEDPEIKKRNLKSLLGEIQQNL